MVNGQVSSHESGKRWIAKNKSRYEETYKKRWETNKVKYNAQKKDLKNQRETFEIDDSLGDPWDDPESLFCDTEFLDGIVGKKVRRENKCKGDA